MSSMKTSQRALATGLVVTALAAGMAANASTKAAGGPVVKFATPVVVDFFHPGYEPDVMTSPAGKYKGSTFVSVPNGFSTTMSYIWRSDDSRRSFHMVEGNAIGKSSTCVGGGDSELQIDPINGAVYFNDLQGLTNFTNSRSNDGGHTWQTSCASVNGAGVDRQWLAIDSNGGTSAVGTGAGDGRLYFDYDNVAQDLGPNGGNQLVMNESSDGVQYGAECNGANVPQASTQVPVVGPESLCPLPPAVISYDEGIPGNVIVNNVKGSKYQHRVYAIHTSGDGQGVIVSWCSGKAGDHTAAAVAQNCTDPTQTDVTQVPSGNLDRKNVNWHDTFARAKGQWQVGNLFPAIRMDTACNLYAVWSEYPGSGAPQGPGAIKMSVSRDGAQHWSSPINVSPASLSNNVMPWIIAGSPGRVGVAWYGSTVAKNSKGQYGPDAVTGNGSWNVYYAMTTNALAKHPGFGVTKVSDHPVKYGDISTGGLGGAHDRSLGDYMQVQLGLHGEAVVTYVDDTSADRNKDTLNGQSAPVAGGTPAEAAGPVMVSVQSAGASMFAGKNVPGIPSYVGSVRNAPGDAFLSTGGQDVAAPKSLDVVGASIKKKDAKTVTVTLTTNDPNLEKDLQAVPPLGGAVDSWLVRWAAPDYRGIGDGNMFYVGMQSNGGQAPAFYTGSTTAIMTTHTKYFTYPQTTKINGVIQGATIIWTLPLSAVGSPKAGQGMYSVTGLTSTQVSPDSSTVVTVPNQGGNLGDLNIPNLISATNPFTYIVH
jgi:hypothetical protein